MGTDGIVTVTRIDDEGERVMAVHPAESEAQRKARLALDGWCGAVLIVSVEVEYADGRLDRAKVPWSEPEDGDGRETHPV
jgi:hypothetical protein